MTIVDIHAHHLPVELGESFTTLSGTPYPMRHSSDLSGHVADMDEAGIDQQVLGLGALQPYWPEERASVDGARFANDLYAQRVADSSGRFRALGAVPLPHAAAAAVEAVRAIDELGFTGIGLGCSAQGIPLDSRDFDEFWAALDDRAALVHLHPGVANSAMVGVAEFPMLLGPVFGSPTETAVATLRLVLAGTVRRFPRVRFVVGAMGGALLTNYTKLIHNLNFGAALGGDVDADEVEAALKSMWFDTSSVDEISMLAARRSVGVERLVFGSDAPWGKAVAGRRELETWTSGDEAVAILERTDAVTR